MRLFTVLLSCCCPLILNKNAFFVFHGYFVRNFFFHFVCHVRHKHKHTWQVFSFDETVLNSVRKICYVNRLMETFLYVASEDCVIFGLIHVSVLF